MKTRIIHYIFVVNAINLHTTQKGNLMSKVVSKRNKKIQIIAVLIIALIAR